MILILRMIRDAEEKLMADVEGWEVGTFYGHKVYKVSNRKRNSKYKKQIYLHLFPNLYRQLETSCRWWVLTSSTFTPTELRSTRPRPSRGGSRWTRDRQWEICSSIHPEISYTYLWKYRSVPTLINVPLGVMYFSKDAEKELESYVI